jgi:hypothetical protein
MLYNGEQNKMKRKPHTGNRFELRFHSGYKRKETPRAVLIGNREFKIDRVLERKRIRDEQTGAESEVFTCDMEGQRIKIVFRDSDDFELFYL